MFGNSSRHCHSSFGNLLILVSASRSLAATGRLRGLSLCRSTCCLRTHFAYSAKNHRCLCTTAENEGAENALRVATLNTHDTTPADLCRPRGPNESGVLRSCRSRNDALDRFSCALYYLPQIFFLGSIAQSLAAKNVLDFFCTGSFVSADFTRC
jgi:hypothetical protein